MNTSVCVKIRWATLISGVLACGWSAPLIAGEPTRLVSEVSRSNIAGAGGSDGPAFSTDGRFLAFVSHANNLVTNDDSAPYLDVFVRDLATNETTLISHGTDGSPANDFSFLPLLSADGRVIVFGSWGDNLLSGDFNQTGDIFALRLPSRPFVDTDGDGLDDNWELGNFGNLLRDGKGDFDGDGASDAAEFAEGT